MLVIVYHISDTLKLGESRTVDFESRQSKGPIWEILSGAPAKAVADLPYCLWE